MKKSNNINLRQHPLTRFFNYFFFFPFLLCLPSLLVNYNTVVIVIYITGFVLVFVLIIYGNWHPLVQISPDGLTLYHNFNKKGKYLPLKTISGYFRKSPICIQLFLVDSPPISLKLGKTDIEKIILKLESDNVNAV